MSYALTAFLSKIFGIVVFGMLLMYHKDIGSFIADVIRLIFRRKTKRFFTRFNKKIKK